MSFPALRRTNPCRIWCDLTPPTRTEHVRHGTGGDIYPACAVERSFFLYPSAFMSIAVDFSTLTHCQCAGHPGKDAAGEKTNGYDPQAPNAVHRQGAPERGGIAVS